MMSHTQGFANSMYQIYVDSSNDVLGTGNVIATGSGNRAP